MKIKQAFTLTEVLMTLVIVGVSSILVVTAINLNINKRIDVEQANAVKYKIGKAMEVMALEGKVKPYPNAEAFVDEFQKYISVTKRCSSDELEKCWPSKKTVIKLDDEGNTFDIKNLTTGTLFMKPTVTNGLDFSSPTVGLILGDGVHMILGFNKFCTKLKPRTYSWTMYQDKPVYNETTSCMAAIIDSNGSRGPNALNKDIFLFNANGIGDKCYFDKKGLCLGAPFLAPELTKDQCEEKREELGIAECYYNPDRWAGCVNACGGIERTASSADALMMFRIFYGYDSPGYNHIADQSWGAGYMNISIRTVEKYGYPSVMTKWDMWTSAEVSKERATTRRFLPRQSLRNSYARSSSSVYCICKGDK